TGVRFFAIVHIFCFHLWVIFAMPKEEQFKTLLSDMAQLPKTLQTFLANGWMSTSFFFLLSGFILAFIYWAPDGQLAMPKKKFWLLRITRIYPIHILLVLLTIALTAGYQISQGASVPLLISSAIATLTLTQAWNPNWVPVWSWPTWTVSALVFLYALMPYLMPRLAVLSRRSMVALLAALPFISLIPTCIYALYFPVGSKPEQFWQIFVGSTPVFWLAHFVAGMLLTRIFGLSRFNTLGISSAKKNLAWGDGAFLAVIAIGCIPDIAEPYKYFLRHGLMMPLYMLIIVDLARGNGLIARLLSFRVMSFLGETGFSIFIWQNMVMIICWIAVMANPALGAHQFKWALVGIVLLGVVSTYAFEKPFSKWLRQRLRH
ncbi:MAG TPA: acyltransferase, partial [Cellvibrionaceae bacterium]|nr:acyltransferase [Cellvibrionaceae bacterium]